MFTYVSETIDQFKDYIDETHGSIELLGVEYYPSNLLEEADPTAFRCGWLDWCDAMEIDTDKLEDDYF